MTQKMVKRLKNQCEEYNKRIINGNEIPERNDIEQFTVLTNILKDIDTDKLKKKS